MHRIRRNVQQKPRVFIPKPKFSKRPSKLKQSSAFDISAGFSDIIKVLTSPLDTPSTIIALVFVSVIVYSHKDFFEKGIVGEWLNKNKGTAIADWILDNDKKIIRSIINLSTHNN